MNIRRKLEGHHVFSSILSICGLGKSFLSRAASLSLSSLSTALKEGAAYRCLLLFFLIANFHLGANQPCLDRLQECLLDFLGSNFQKAQIVPACQGNSNATYIVGLDSQKYFVKIGDVSNELFDVSMKQEWECNKLAAEWGLAPQVLYYNLADRLMITEFIDVTGYRVDIRDPKILLKYCDSLQKLHSLDGKNFPVASPIQRIESYLTKVQERGIHIPDVWFLKLIPVLNRIEKRYPFKKLVPCHLDLHTRNMMYDGSKLWFIDWEYAALSDPFYDLAFLVIGDNLSQEEMVELLRVYGNGSEPTNDEIAYLHAMCFLGELRESLWSYLKNHIFEPENSYIPRANRFLHKALTRLETPYLRKTLEEE